MTSDFGQEFLAAAHGMAAELVSIRRTIHQNPELRYQEFETAALVKRHLTEMGIESKSVAGTGVVGLIEGSQPGKTVLLRADMDALPLDEENDLPFKSCNAGVMHACGHDGHTAMLLGAARLLHDRKAALKGNVKLMFQPAEEAGGRGGALPMIEEGLLDSPAVDAAFALHCGGLYKTGQVSLRPGPMMAASDRFKVTVIGQGGHGGMPHNAVDSIVIAAHILLGLQTVVSRELPPFEAGVLTVGSIQSGDALSVSVSERTELYGTARSYIPAVREQLERRVRQVSEGVAAAFRASVEVEWTPGYPSLSNDASATALVESVAKNVLGSDSLMPMPLQLGAEDFSQVLNKVPGAYFFLGVSHPSWPKPKPIHSNEFMLDEDALPLGTAMLASVAMRYLDAP